MIKKVYILGVSLVILFLINCGEIEVGEKIGPGGGIVSGEGVTLTIPPGALKESHEFSFNKWFDYPYLPSCYKDISSRAVLINPARLLFRKPVSIEMTYNNEDIGQSDPNKLILLGYDQINNYYRLLGNKTEDINDFKVDGDYPFVSSVILTEFTGDWYQGPSSFQISGFKYINTTSNDADFTTHTIVCSVYDNNGPVSGVELRWGLRPHNYWPFGYGSDTEISAGGWTYKGSNSWNDWKFNSFITDEIGNADCVIVVPLNNTSIFYSLQIWYNGEEKKLAHYHIIWEEGNWLPSNQKLYIPVSDDKDDTWGCSNHPPVQPSNPFPLDKSVDVKLGVVLSWNCADQDNDPLKYDVYFGTSSNPPIVAKGITKRSYDPSGDLSKNKKYYWKIKASDGKDETIGPLWCFTTGVTSGGGNDGNLIWKYKTQNVVESSPYVSNGLVFIGGADCYMYCILSKDGSLVWKYKTGDSIFSSPYEYDGKVYVGSLDFSVYCFSSYSGSLIWRYETGNIVYSSPFLYNGKIYVGSWDGYVYCLSSNDGSLIWRYKTGDMVLSSPYVENGRVYIGSLDTYVYCLSADSGDVIWMYETGNWITSSPYVVSGKVYVCSWDDYIYCLSSTDGSLIWKYKTGGSISSSPCIVDGRIYIGSDDGFIYCLSDINGSVMWMYGTSDYVRSSPYVIDERVYVGSHNGYIYCLSSYNGFLIWRYKTSSAVPSSPYVIDERLYIGSNDFFVYCISTETDKQVSQWNFLVDNKNDNIYIKSTDFNYKIPEKSNKWVLK